jgi:hypothetical protein
MTTIRTPDKYNYPVCVSCYDWLKKPKTQLIWWSTDSPPGPAPERASLLERWHEDCFLCGYGTISGLYLKDPPEAVE